MKLEKMKRKLTSVEKKEVVQFKKQQKEIQRIKKEMASTLSWMDIDEVQDNRIILKRGSKTEYVMGYKILPHNIFIDETNAFFRRIQAVRSCFNQAPGNLYFQFVYSPVNADSYVNNVNYLLSEEEDKVVKKMLEADLEKMEAFKRSFKELEFFVLIKNSDPRKLEKDMDDLYGALQAGLFYPEELNKRDFFNYISYAFENNSINDYMFGRGILSYLNQKIQYNEAKDKLEKTDSTEDFSMYGTPIYNIRPAIKRIEKSKLAPTGFGIKNNYLIVGNKYVSNLLVEKFTTHFTEGFLCEFLNDPRIKLFMLDRHLKGVNMAQMLRRDLAEMQQRYEKTTDRMVLARIQNDLESQEQYIEQVIRDNDITHDVVLVLQIWADELKELEQARLDLMNKVSTYGLTLSKGNFIQEELFKMVNPLWIDINLPSVVLEQFGQPMPSTTVAGLYPWVFDTLKDEKGFLFGHEKQNGGIVLFDPAYYMHNPFEATRDNRVNGNMVVLGKAGSGKTTAMNLNIRNFIRNKWKIIWIDPENKNDRITKKYNGTFVNWGQRDNIINIFDLKPISTDDDEDDSKKWDTELAIFNVIEDVNLVFQYLFPTISENTLALVGELVKKTYEEVGIVKDKNGKYESFKDKQYEDMPTFTDFNRVLEARMRLLTNSKKTQFEKESEYLNDLHMKLQRLLNEWSIYFNGHTTVKLPDEQGRQIISFGTKKLFNLPDNLQTALYYVMFTYAWSLCLDETQESAFIIDEAHTMILKGKTAELVAQFYRRSRKYKNIMCTITQSPRDFADEKVLTHGKAIFQNAVYKIIMNLDKDGVTDVAKLDTLNDNEQLLIQDLMQGDSLFICGSKRLPIHVLATDNELIEMGAGYN